MGIFSRTRFCLVAKALCIDTKARSVGDNEMERECCPLWIGMCPLAQVTMLKFSPGPRKKNAILKYQVTVFVSHSLYHCHWSACWLIQDCQTNIPVVDEAPLFILKVMNHTHSLSCAERVSLL